MPLAIEAVEIRRWLGVLAARLDGASRSEEARAVRREAEALAG